MLINILVRQGKKLINLKSKKDRENGGFEIMDGDEGQKKYDRIRRYFMEKIDFGRR